MTQKANVNDVALTDLVTDWLRDSGYWKHVPGVPHLAWVDLRAERLGDGRAMHIGEAVKRQCMYEARGA